jgi:pilus assembly protein Flp/PilA
MSSIKRFISNDEGATMAEYGLLIALIAIVCIAGVRLLGNNVNNTFTSTAGSI